MAVLDGRRVLDAWATAWSAHDTERVLALFTDDCIYEDVTFGAVCRGAKELRAFADGVFAAVPDFKIELTTRFTAGSFAGMEWVMSGTHQGEFPGNADYWDAATVMRQVGLLPS
jgi:steroid delta-isomerase-like uncharacterized protein